MSYLCQKFKKFENFLKKIVFFHIMIYFLTRLVLSRRLDIGLVLDILTTFLYSFSVHKHA